MEGLLSGIGDAIGSVWKYIDWLFYIFLLVFTAKFLEQAWLFLRQGRYKKMAEEILYEIKIPREIERGPKAMDQFFSGLHAFRNVPGSLGEKYYDGEVTRKFSFELLGTNGNIHMFMRVPRFYGDAVKSMLYAQYNDLEIVERDEDYLNMLPRSYDDLRKIGYEIWGMEADLESEVPYPLKTYAEFEEKSSDERVVDPIAFFLEVVSNMPSDESIMVQLVMKPAGDEWKVRGHAILKEMNEALKIYRDGEFTGRQERETESQKTTAKAIDE